MSLNKSIGRRDVMITINRLEVVKDPGGGTESSFVKYWETWAEVREIRATRVAENYQDRLKKVFALKVRYRSDKTVTSDMRIIIKGKDYAIDGIDNIEDANTHLEIIAVASKV